MRKDFLISSLLALGLGFGAASAQETAPATEAPATEAPATEQVEETTTTETTETTETAGEQAAVAQSAVQFSDVPAGHWAKEAVEKIAQCGLIQGFPDGTFRGNENLTRYQAALIFHRLLTSKALSECGFSSGDNATIVKGMQEVSTELAAISARLGDVEKANAEQAARIAALEEKIASIGEGGKGGGADLTAVNARIDALEQSIKNIPAGKPGPKGEKGDPGAPGAPADTGAGDVTTEPGDDTAVVVPGDDDDLSAPALRNFYAGIHGGANMTDKATNGCKSFWEPKGKKTNQPFCLKAGAVVGARNLFGPVGARVTADYNPAKGAISADAAVTADFNLASNFGAYLGLGFGVTASKGHLDSTKNKTDLYGGGFIGVEYGVTESIAVYAEADGRYYLSNNGVGTGLPKPDDVAAAASTKKGGPNFGGRLGVKFYF